MSLAGVRYQRGQSTVCMQDIRISVYSVGRLFDMHSMEDDVTKLQNFDDSWRQRNTLTGTNGNGDYCSGSSVDKRIDVPHFVASH